MEKDPLRIKTEGDFIFAEGTSLGGDDGIAVAYILAILDSDDIAHPRIEAVITTDEEVGMEGATAIDLSMLKAKRMLNIDSEEEGILLTSCAGGMRMDCHIPIIREDGMDGIFLKICTGGLLGGHSGTEINKEHTNAIKLLGITLQQIRQKVPFRLVEISGGEKDNAIPREAAAVVCLPKEQKEAFANELSRIEKEEKMKRSQKKRICISGMRKRQQSRHLFLTVKAQIAFYRF